MEIAFDAIGIEITNETAFNDLAEDARVRGEVSRLTRKSGVQARIRLFNTAAGFFVPMIVTPEFLVHTV